MSTWHQEKRGLPVLYHKTLWTAYNPAGHLGVMRFETKEDCLKYCDATGDIPLPPTQPITTPMPKDK